MKSYRTRTNSLKLKKNRARIGPPRGEGGIKLTDVGDGSQTFLLPYTVHPGK